MNENGWELLRFEPPEEENMRLREENARLRRLLAGPQHRDSAARTGESLQRPSRPHHPLIKRSVPVDGSHYFAVSSVGEKMSTLGAGNVKMGSLDIRGQR